MMSSQSKAELTAERLRELLHYNPDSGAFTRKLIVTLSRQFNSGDVAGGLDKSTGYIRVSVDGKRYWAHRLAWLYTNGKWPAHCIDHINGNPLDNRICNLREASKSENGQNINKPRANNEAGVYGVAPCKKTGKWQASITVNGKQKSLGRFLTPQEAGAAYLRAKSKLHPYAPTQKIQ